jgi:hypothetical protein
LYSIDDYLGIVYRFSAERLCNVGSFGGFAYATCDFPSKTSVNQALHIAGVYHSCSAKLHQII